MTIQLKLLTGLVAISVLLIMGTVGYYLIEGWTLLNSLYMTVITMSTVGFKEVGELSAYGQIFTILLIFTSLGTVAYLLSGIVSFLVEGSLDNILKGRRKAKMIAQLKDHYIICGAGQTGKHALQVLQKAKAPFVVIEKNKEKIDDLLEQKILTIHGNATQDDVLIEAGIKKAKAVISALNDDADNVFTVLSCRQLNPNIYIAARAIEPSSETKLVKAGANFVVSPNAIGGQRLASSVLEPAVISFLDIVHNQGAEEIPINIQEVVIDADSCLAGKSLREANVRKNTGLTVLGVIKGDMKVFNPSSDYILQQGDILLAFGSNEQVGELKNLCRKG